MPDKYKSQYDVFINKALEGLNEDTPVARAFIKSFYSRIPAMEMDEISKCGISQKIALDAMNFFVSAGVNRPEISIKVDDSRSKTQILILNNDMPFLVDSVSSALKRNGVIANFIIHPILSVRRDANGSILEISDDRSASKKFNKESLIYVESDSLPQGISASDVESYLRSTLQAVIDANSDKSAILDRLKKAQSEVKDKEAKEFLDWLAKDNFIFLGFEEYSLDAKGKAETLANSSLGLFKIPSGSVNRPLGIFAIPESLRISKSANEIEITKSSKVSLIHKPILMDYVTITKRDKTGDVIGEMRFLGLFPSDMSHRSVNTIPLVRTKIDSVIKRADFDYDSFDGKTLRAILESFPRDELMQISEDDLFEISLGVLSLSNHPTAIRLFSRSDRYMRFASVLVYIPREFYGNETLDRVKSILEKAFNGKIGSQFLSLTEMPHARIQMTIETNPMEKQSIDIAEIENNIAEAITSWQSALEKHLKTIYGESEAQRLYSRFSAALTNDYRSFNTPKSAAHDIGKFKTALDTLSTQIEIYESAPGSKTAFGLKIYTPYETTAALSDIIPMLENMGVRVVDERPFLIRMADGAVIGIRDFQLSGDNAADALKNKDLFETALLKVWNGEVENDSMNRLVLASGITYRHAEMLRAYSKYLKQVGFAYDLSTIAKAFSDNPEICKLMVRAFDERFNPVTSKKAALMFRGTIVEIEHELGNVKSAVDDRICRTFAEIMQATLRTNFFCKDKPYISFKFDCSKVPGIPKPRPFAEIFVYSTRFEGIHLRGGKVSRGGLRWSDRRDDFRTEILGLMKAQMVKNSVIVPVGAKGGFVLKRTDFANRDEFMEEGVFCYKNFLRGLLDITDNLVAGKIVHPENVVRHDKDDPYLVVAADKGTATFSDYANSVSQEYGFWLDDAFASGGSQGYDHKAMGITAKGAWISVVRHFREMGIEVDKDGISVVGIGDMSGDVFGNGMLLSKAIKLVGAFNHMHIFIDPSPDAAKSYEERLRLFKLPRSSWKDYNEKLISKGGGVFERAAKTIDVSKEMREIFKIKVDVITPDELIKAMLTSPVDLLWNGGIGTYVKSESESNDRVGDKANDALRVNGSELKAKVVGEGGNLGFTQLGRIEYAMSGGRINTDAIDNSAGVDCSDHEVNIKIAFASAVQKGNLTTEKRNKILEQMTENVAKLVLRDNQLQTQAVSILESDSAKLLESQSRYMTTLEKAGLLDRKIEYLPSDEQLEIRQKNAKGLTRPELAVLLAYSKIDLYRHIITSDLPDDEYFEKELLRYFPDMMKEDFKEDIASHRLRREIIATATTNSMINRVGSTFINQAVEESGYSAPEVAKAYTIVRDLFDLRDVWAAIESQDGKIEPAKQIALFKEINAHIYQSSLWFLRNATRPLNIENEINLYKPSVLSVINSSGDIFERVQSIVSSSAILDIAWVAKFTGKKLSEVQSVYQAYAKELDIDWLKAGAKKISTDDYWQSLAVATFKTDLSEEFRRIISSVCKTGNAPDKFLADRFVTFVKDIRAHANHLEIPMLSVILRRLREVK